jgi:hypothetical protein
LSTVTPQTAQESILNSALFQVYYRQLGIVSLNFGINDIFTAATYLAANGRGGTVSWVALNRVAQWQGVIVAPGYSDSPTIDLWLVGGQTFNKNTVLIRKGFWYLYLPNIISAAINNGRKALGV